MFGRCVKGIWWNVFLRVFHFWTRLMRSLLLPNGASVKPRSHLKLFAALKNNKIHLELTFPTTLMHFTKNLPKFQGNTNFKFSLSLVISLEDLRYCMLAGYASLFRHYVLLSMTVFCRPMMTKCFCECQICYFLNILIGTFF